MNTYRINKYSAIRLVFYTSLYSVLFNFYDFPLLDLVDVFVMAAFLGVVVWSNLNIKYIFCVILLLSILTFSNLNGLLLGISTNVDHVAFYYKWFFILMTAMTLQKVVTSKRLALELNRHVLLVGVLLSFWVIVYTPLRVSGYLSGSWRASFPFTSDFYASDAHVISSLLSIIISFNYLNKTVNLFSFHTILFFIAILMTGSRTGVVIFFCAVLFVTTTNFLLFQRSKAVLSRKLVYGIILTLSLIPFVYFFVGTYIDVKFLEFSNLASRALDVGFDDASSQGRLRKLSVSFEELNVTGFLLGPGFMQSKLMWYDNGLAILITHGGLLFVFILSVLLIHFWINNKSNTAIIVQSILILIAYTITEQFLISRHVVFVISLFFISYKIKNVTTVKSQNHVG